MRERIVMRVAGRVQNVGFRAYVQAQANSLGLSGWVRNLDDGRQLELEAEGERTRIDAFEAAVRRGPRGARIEGIAVERRVAAGTDEQFVVR